VGPWYFDFYRKKIFILLRLLAKIKLLAKKHVSKTKILHFEAKGNWPFSKLPYGKFGPGCKLVTMTESAEMAGEFTVSRVTVKNRVEVACVSPPQPGCAVSTPLQSCNTI